MAINGYPYFGRRAILQLDTASYECGAPEGLDVEFSVRSTTKPGPNTATITLYNPARETSLYADLRQRELRVRLFAGWGDNVALLIEGNPVKNGVSVERDGPDRLLKLEINDCLRKYQTGRVRFAIRGATTLGAVVDQTLAQLGLPAGLIDIDRDTPIPSGFRASGQVRDVLSRVAGIAGADWSFRNGRLEMYKRKGQKVISGPGFSTEQATIWGWPSRTKDGISVPLPLDARLAPGRGFTLDMEESYYSGAWRAIDVEHRGSTSGGDWITQVSAKRWR